MLGVAELVLPLLGLYMVVKGKIKLGETRECRGTPARVAGLFLMSIVPNLLLIFAIVEQSDRIGQALASVYFLVDFVVVAFGVVPAVLIVRASAKPIVLISRSDLDCGT